MDKPYARVGFLKYYRGLLRQAPEETLTATEKLQGWGALVLAIAAFFSKELAEWLETEWAGLSRWWAVVPIVIFVGYRFLRINYENLEEIREENHDLQNKIDVDRPDFTMELGQLVRYFLSGDNQTLAYIGVEAINRGSDSVACKWRVFYKSSTFDGEVEVKRILNARLNKMMLQDGQLFSTSDEENVMNRGAKPITKGSLLVGYLPFVVPGNRIEEMGKDAHITVAMSDYLGNEYRATFKSGGPQKLKHYPKPS